MLAHLIIAYHRRGHTTSIAIFSAGVDPEKVREACFVGLSTKPCELMTLPAKPASSPASHVSFFNTPKIYTNLHTGSMLKTWETSSQLLKVYIIMCIIMQELRVAKVALSYARVHIYVYIYIYAHASRSHTSEFKYTM